MSSKQDELASGALSSPDGGLQVRIIAWITAICLLGDSMYYIVLPIYWKQFGLDALWQVGFLLSINRFVRLPLNPLIGWLYGRISKRAGVLTAVILACLTTLGYGCLSGFASLVIARALWGIAWGLLRLGGYLTVLEASTAVNRGRLLGSYNGIMGFGSLIGMLAGGMLADAIGARPVALGLGVLMLAGIPFALRYVPASVGSRSAAGSRQSGNPPTGKVLWPGRAWLVLVSGLGTAIIFFGVYLSTLSALIEARLPGPGGTLTLFGAVWGAASVAGFVQALRWAWSPYLSPRIGSWSDGPRGREPLNAASLALAAAALALLLLPLPLAVWFAVLLAAQLASTAIVTLGDTLAADTAAGVGRVGFMTTYTTVVDVGAAVGPMLAFALIGPLGLSGIYGLCAAISLGLAAAWAVVLLRRRPA